MKRFFFLGVLLVLSLILPGCAFFGPARPAAARRGAVEVLPVYSGPKARIVVADFEVKVSKLNPEIGSGLREMLVAVLEKSNRFSVLEPKSREAAKVEQEAAVSPAQEENKSRPEKAKADTTRLIVAATVTEFEPQASGGSAGSGGGGGSASGALGGLLGVASNKAQLALDIRVIRQSTSEVLLAVRLQGQASDISGSPLTGLLGDWKLGSGLEVYANTPMERAVRTCLIEVVRYLSKEIPLDYFNVH